MPGFGGSIKLTGEEAYRQALKGIAADLKNVAAEQKLTASTYDKADTSLSALSKRSEDLKSKLATQEQKWKALSNALKDYQSQQEKNKTVIQSVQTQLDKERQKLEEVAKQFGTTSKEYKDQAKVVDELEQQLKELNTQFDKNEITLKNTQAALTGTEADMKKTKDAMQKLGKQAEEAGVGSEKLGLAVDDAGKKAQNAADGGFTVIKGVLADLSSKVIQKAVEGFKQLAQNVYEAGTNFDAAMSKVGAISGATGKDLDALTDKAKALGESTKFSASEVADGFSYMAMAGWKTEDMLNGIEGVLNLAAAAGSDLATTSDIVTDALTAMGYSASDAGRLADVMAAASSNANTNVEMMGETFKYAASVAGSLGYSMEDVALATGLMANSGVKASQAGTALRSIMQRIATDTGDAATTMHAMGVETTNADGTMRPLGDVMVDLRKAMANLTDEQKTATAKTIAGTEAMGGLLAIVNASETDYNKLSTAINNSTGAAERMAGTMQNNVAGKMTALKSQLEGIYLTIWNKVEPAVSKAISSISKALRNVNWEDFGRKAGEALGKLVDGFTWLLKNGDIVIAAIKGILAAFVVAKITSFVTSIAGLVSQFMTAYAAAGTLTGALQAMNMTMMANPIGLVVGLLAGLAVALKSVADSSKEVDQEAQETKERIEDLTSAIDDNADSWESLKKSQQESIDAGMTQITKVEMLKDELLEIVDANGKVKEGYEDRADFILGQLNEALGTEYSMTGDIIDNYKELVDSIDELIEKKKAEIILNSQEAAYQEALTKRAESYRNLKSAQDEYNASREKEKEIQDEVARLEAEYALTGGVFTKMRIDAKKKELEAQQETTNGLKTEYDKQLEALNQYAFTVDQYETNMQLAHDKKYDEMSTVNWEYVKDYQDAGDAQKSEALATNDYLETQLEHLKSLKDANGEYLYKKQIEQTEKQLDENRRLLDTLNGDTENKLNANTDFWLGNAATTLSKMSGKRIEFKKVGKDQVQYYEDGIAQGAPMAEKEAESMVKDVLGEFDKEAEAEGAGKNVITGFTNGEGNFSLQNAAFRVAQTFAGDILTKLKQKLGIASPSKETRAMGGFLVKGIPAGIKSEEKIALNAAEDFGESIIDAMNSGLSAGVDTSAIADLQNAIPEDISANYRVKTGADNLATLQAEIERKSMVSAFKEALSQVKVEMDDQEMARFVDKTVSRAIYG